jgi:predicted nucleotidyltransferase
MEGPILLDLTGVDRSFLDVVDRVTTELLAKSARLKPSEVLLVGAHARDILQSAFGYEFPLRVTSDIDLGLAVANWDAYDELVTRLRPAGNTGIRFQVAQTIADLMPFGSVEDPPGTVAPANRREPISVWGFAEVFAAGLPLRLPAAGTIRIPTAAGYAALKLAAWLDRSAYGEYKDASDIATVVYWYSRSSAVAARVYETAQGQELLVQEDLDDASAAARLLGEDVADLIGAERLAEIAGRWLKSPRELLIRHMTVTNAPGWPDSSDRRQVLLRAVERGLRLSPVG